MAIAPVAHAIRVLEKITPPEGLLFDRNVHDFSRRRTLTGAPKQHTVRARITDFIAWCTTEAARHGLEHQTSRPTRPGTSAPRAFAAPSPGTSPAAPAAWPPWPSSAATCARASTRRVPAGTAPAPAAESRFDKKPESYPAGLHLRGTMIWIKDLTKTTP